MALLNYKIATIGSHSALQILKGAKDEGFSTIAICLKGREKPYKIFNVADEIIVIKNYKGFQKIQNKLIKRKAIIIPHASFITYMGHDDVEKFKVPYYGNKKILKYEEDRHLERVWLKKAGLKLPKIFKKPKDIDRPVIVKFHGAKGGKGYFIAKNERDFKRKIKLHPEEKKYVIQEYILGVHMYIHYFYSSLTNELEIEDLELLNQSYKILEDEYIAYFEEARKESKTARYAAIKSYERQRVQSIYNNAKKFIAKLSLMI